MFPLFPCYREPQLRMEATLDRQVRVIQSSRGERRDSGFLRRRLFALGNVRVDKEAR